MIGSTARQTKRLIGPTHHAGLATIPSSSLRVGSTLRLGSPCPRDRDQITGESNCCIVRVTSKNILVQNEHFLREGRSIPSQDILPTTAEQDDVEVLRLGNDLRAKDIHGPEEFASYSLNIIQNAGLRSMKLSVTLWQPLAMQYLCSNVIIAYHIQRHPWIVGPVW